MRKRVCLALVTIVLIAGLAACATNQSFIRDSYLALSVSKQSYDFSFNALASLYRQDILTVDQAKEAIRLGYIYMSAHNAAVSALLVYEAAAGDAKDPAKVNYLSCAAEASKALVEFLEFARPFLTK